MSTTHNNMNIPDTTDITQRQVLLGTKHVNYPSEYLQPLEDSNHLLNDVQALHAQLHNKGYLYLRGFHDREEVNQARLAVLDYIHRSGTNKLDPDQPWQSGILDSRCGYGCVPAMEGVEEITHHESIKRVLEGARPHEFFRRMFGEEAATFGFKWLRGVHREAYTGAHVDKVYMGRGTDTLLTMWTPFDDVPVEMGTLAMCEGSNRLSEFSRLQETYGDCDIEQAGLEGSGWFTHDPVEITSRFGGQWKTTDFQMGDVLIFTIRTVHMSTANLTNRVRISCDTRWQAASAAMDERYRSAAGNLSGKFGLSTPDRSEKNGDKVTMALLKEQWGFH